MAAILPVIRGTPLSNRFLATRPLQQQTGAFLLSFLRPLAYRGPYPFVQFSLALPTISTGLRSNLQALISDLWDSILRAVPKKKQSHSRKRMRQLAGKALQDITSLAKCPGCGGTKRSHCVCPTCEADIRDMWKARSQDGEGANDSANGDIDLTPTADNKDIRGSGSQPSI